MVLLLCFPRTRIQFPTALLLAFLTLHKTDSNNFHKMTPKVKPAKRKLRDS